MKGDTVEDPDFGRYDDEGLGRMLESYRRLARDHADRGHYALAKWAQRMATNITIEMNEREYAKALGREEQLSLDELHYPAGIAGEL